MNLKDRIVLLMMKIIQKMGYCFYIRKCIDSSSFNGSDIAMFKHFVNINRVPDEFDFKIIAISGSGLNWKDSLDNPDNKFLGKL